MGAWLSDSARFVYIRSGDTHASALTFFCIVLSFYFLVNFTSVRDNFGS